MEERFRIVGGKLGERERRVEFQLQGSGSSFPVFFSSSEAVLEANREAFVACALVPAMSAGVGLDLAGPASVRLVSALPEIVDIYTAWHPHLKPLSLPGLVPVANTRPPSGRVGAFFSGGVDSCYTFLKHRDEVTDLIFVHGFDIPLDRVDLLPRAVARVNRLASEFGVGVVHVQTNLKAALRPFITWGTLGHGVALATIGHLLASVFDRVYIASSCHYADLFPWGTHPLLDPLWSSEAIEFVHDGCEARRIDKVEFIAGFDAVLRCLRVCYQRLENVYNCGRCEKCVRTMISLEAVGKLCQCRTFDPPLDVERVRRLRVHPEIRAFFLENLHALQERGLRPDLQRALARSLRRPRWLDAAERRAQRWLGRYIPGLRRPRKVPW